MKTVLIGLSFLISPFSFSVAQTYVIRADAPRQTIRHFGASDAWSMQTIGLWPDSTEQAKIADWLFSLDTNAEGQPRGIGLSLWRFNLGAGSAEQGRESQISRSTRTECFLQPDGTYDWTRQTGQRHFLQLAKERGVPYFLAFLNSPPVYFTQNGLATNTGRDGTLNLRPDCYDRFAQFIATALRGLEEHDGIHFDYLCPVNEPDGHWNWQGPKQEGSPATNREIARLARSTNDALRQQQLKTQLLVNESSDLRCLLGIYKTDWQRGNTIRTFFSKDSTQTYLGDLPRVPRIILGHSYWTNTPVPYMKLIRQQLRDTCRHYGIRFWQSELCIMSNDEEIGGGGGYDFSMKTALYVARVIHHDLCYADAESWSWWRACGGDYKDGLIRVYEHRSSPSFGGSRGEVARDSRLLWALGNYSRFVRPGAVRYEVDGPEAPYGLMVSAYRNTDGRWVVVALNYADTQADFDFSVNDGQPHRWQVYRTSDVDGETLKPINTVEGSTTLPSKSITTLVAQHD
jgi:O-glycosyl hydrolase